MKKDLHVLLTAVCIFLIANISFPQTGTDNISVSVKKPDFLSVDGTWADSVFHSLSPEERIAQLFMVAAYSSKDQNHVESIKTLVKDYKIGGLIFFKGSPIKQAQLTNQYQSLSKTPLFIAIDGEWGLSMRLDSTVKYPRQMLLGAIQDENLVYRMGKDIAEQCKRMGIHINFAPVIDVNNNPANPVINNRSFGENKEKVTQLGLAYMKGMQDLNILACGKHFPGHGDTDMDSHKSLPTILHDYKRLDSLELYPFKKLTDQGLASMMVAHLSIPSLDPTKNQASTLSKKIVTDLLKDSLGFEGLVFTDALNMKGVSAYYQAGEIDVKAILAGNDVLLFPEAVPTGINAIKSAIANGQISQEEIDERCLKILRAKEWAHLNSYQPIDTEKLIADLNKTKYEALNHQLNKAAITLIQNHDSILPFSSINPQKTLYLNFGGTSDNSFEKTMRLYADFDVLKIPRSLSANDEKNLFEHCEKYDRIILGFHRTNNNPKRNFGITKQAIAIHNLLSEQQEVITVLFGNPYVVDGFGNIDATKAFLIAYQDNDYTQIAAAQTLFGGITPKGKLPVSISPSFPQGFGLEYKKSIRLAHVLPEEIDISSDSLAEIDKIALEGIRKGAFPGCQIVGIKQGQVFYNKSFGYHTYEKERPVKNNDIYDLASITKIAATTISLIRLQHEGVIHLDSTLSTYLPELVDSTPYQNMVLREMLAHQAGLFPWIPFYTETLVDKELDWEFYSKDSTARTPAKVADQLFIPANYDTTILRTITERALIRKRYKYSDLGYYFFKRIIEDATGLTLDEYVYRNFYEPMNLRYTTYRPLYKFEKAQITPTENDKIFRKQLVWGNVHDPGAALQGGVGGHAGLFSNALDLGTLMYMLINNGQYGVHTFLSPQTIEEFTSCQYCPRNRRGAGFDKPVRSLDGGPTCDKVSLSSFGHSGFTGTLTWADPEKEIVYVFLSNRVYPDANNWLITKEDIRTRIQDALYRAADF
ncbi:glycoside hydrolase family 3 N-terminal domain-containing protein [Crocinitomix algicola]|uniref:glycoside hydrolase family 3 N-terminal domain-containing protein n=1 Tax=Crocinitomix algicola TaxID=1740263 RepID=UPI000872F157|nr:glycoside hydrolase family 3 N-terminal domain-containing protein [Crocinitomix algicola]